NLNKHYKKVHGIDIQIQELEISGVGELNQEGFISHWSLPGTGKQALESSCERIRGGKFEEIEEHFFEHWLRLFSEKGYTVAMVQAFRRTSESKHISKSEIKSFLEVVKPIKKKPQIQETTVCGKELSESVELIKELHLSSVKGVKKAIHTVGRDSQEQAAFRKAVSMNYNHRCAITGDEVAVEACHIQTHANYFDNSLDNGVLLSVGLHRLFDAGIMIICPETMTISFTRNCFYKKYLDGALVKQGRIPISKKKLSEKNSGIKICHEITPGLRDVIAEQDGDYTGR
ncbi:TPA: HNH endonuclease, partial [Klebsiella pneumoniae]|nr:HNH endonuclease [Klebsiella pneumoniae]